MEDLLYKLFNTHIPKCDEIDFDRVSEYRKHFEKLVEDYFSEMKEHLKSLSVNKSTSEIIKYISKEKNEILKVKEKIREKELEQNSKPLTVEEYQTLFGLNKEDAIMSLCYDKIHEIQFDIINKSYLKLMALHREYSNDLLFELKRFDIDFFGYNDIPWGDVLNESSNCLQWLSELFNEYFDKLIYEINLTNDWNKIDTLIYAKIVLFNQIKNELSEKEKSLIEIENTLATKVSENNVLDKPKTGAFLFVCIETLYNIQHKYIDNAIEKLNKLHENYLPKLSSITTPLKITKQNQTKINKEPKEKSFADYLNHPNKVALMAKLHELIDNEKAKKIAMVIFALKELNFCVFDKKEEIYRTLNKEFGDTSTKQAKNAHLHLFENPSPNEKQKEAIQKPISKYIEILKSVPTE